MHGLWDFLMEINFHLDIDPVPKGRARHGTRGHVFTPPRTKAYEQHLKSLFKQRYRLNPLNVPLKVYLEFILLPPKNPKFRLWPAVRSDLDNYIKSTLDAANGIIYEDDSLICDIRAIKIYGKKPGIIMKVEEL